jgi:hypothetical protein
MPIDTNDAFKSIRFNYTNENDPNFILAFEFHHTPEFGPTVTIHNLEIGPLSLPASAYTDAVDFLRGDGGALAPAVMRVPLPQNPGAGVGRKLTPTRVANTAVIRQPQPAQESTPPSYQTPLGYADQTAIFSSNGAAESFAAPSRPAKKTGAASPAKVPAPRPPPAEPEAEDESQEEAGLDPNFSLANAKVRRQRMPARRIGKRIMKPGDPGYEEWLAKQQAEGTE